jgi:hypothetical protein
MTHTKRGTYYTNTHIRKCKICGIEAHTKDGLYHFVKSTEQKETGRRNRCKKCHNQKNKGRVLTRKTVDRNLNWRATKQYNCTVDEYYERMATSDVCEVCGAKNKDKAGYKLCYDHDHTTMKFRGVLCTNCNRAIGQLGDTKESIKKVLNYLER